MRNNFEYGEKNIKAKNPQLEEPFTDLFIDTHHALVVLEIPGITELNILYGDRIALIQGVNEFHFFEKKVEVPFNIDKNKTQIQINHGIAEIHFFE
jgi:HSP20 family molecular chaperone IbpA